MRRIVPDVQDQPPDSPSGWPESHGSAGGVVVPFIYRLPVEDLGNGSCLLPGDEEAPNLVYDRGALVFGPGQRRFTPHTAAATCMGAAEGRGHNPLSRPAPGPVVGAGPGVTPGGGA
jgi:hypothetical protein